MKKHIQNIISSGIVLAAGIAGANKIIDILAEKEDHLPMKKGRYFSWKYGNIYYTKNGKGKPLLLIHDLNTCSSSYEWSKVNKKLSKNYTVYTMDLLGCGRSDKPNLTYTSFLYVQLVNDFIRKIIGSRTNIVATGYSLPFVIMSCQMETKNFNKIIGVSPCDIYNLTKTPDKKRNILKYLLDTPVLGTFLYNIKTSKNRITEQISRDYFYKSHLVSEKQVNAYYTGSKTSHSHGKYLYASIKSCYTNINIIPAIEKINNSICLIGGREQPFIHDIIDEYCAHNSSIEEAYISNTSYLPQMESPEKFVELLQILL
ncbi:MAG: alpha/beta fold hydrolase [Clostridiales bacterium]|nr:alpha/beta fold hydrolase [Clostridiales bacterium]